MLNDISIISQIEKSNFVNMCIVVGQFHTKPTYLHTLLVSFPVPKSPSQRLILSSLSKTTGPSDDSGGWIFRHLYIRQLPQPELHCALFLLWQFRGV